ncbi:hypothetical protein KFU94_23085 [Chloroflexi bacterium TSY]|nr:hypothetical protein [Chloroflexi bacterium TSY]
MARWPRRKRPIYGGIGNDKLWGVSGQDHLDGGDGTEDKASFELYPCGVDVDLSWHRAIPMQSGPSCDFSVTLFNVEIVLGSSFNDSIVGNSQPNELYGRDGDDTLKAGHSNDLLSGGDGTDTCTGGIQESCESS